MRMIIAPTDFSVISLNAVNYAADLALSINMDLLLIHVSAVPVLFSEVPTPVYSRITEMKEAEEQLVALKEKLIIRLKNRIRVVTEVREGEYLHEIEACCEHIHPFAVVIGSESADPFERFLFGGKALTTATRLAWPLLIVPPGAAFDHIYRAGLACDLIHVNSTLPHREIRDIVNTFSATLHVLHVTPHSDFAENTRLRGETEWLQEMLGALNPQVHYIHDSDITGGIRDLAKKLRLDLLIVIPKKHGVLENMFHKSQTRQLVLKTEIPVMTIHA